MEGQIGNTSDMNNSWDGNMSDTNNSLDISVNETLAEQLAAVDGGGMRLFSIVMITFQLLCMVVIVSGNTLVLVAISRFHALRDITGKFVANLAVADLLCGLFLPFQVVFFLYPELNSNKMACLLRYQVIIFTTMSSMFSLFCTVMDRYLAIAHHYLYVRHVTDQFAKKMIVLSWVYSLVFALLPPFGLNNWNSAPVCIYAIVINKDYRLALALHFIMLSVTMFASYINILTIIRRHQRQIHQEMELQPRRSTASVGDERQMLNAVTMVVLLFQVSWLPFTIMQLIMYDTFSRTKEIVSSSFVFLGILNSIVNPIVYAWKNKKYRRAFRKVLCHVWNWEELGDSLGADDGSS